MTAGSLRWPTLSEGYAHRTAFLDSGRFAKARHTPSEQGRNRAGTLQSLTLENALKVSLSHIRAIMLDNKRQLKTSQID